jgi:hypothetical protein
MPNPTPLNQQLAATINGVISLMGIAQDPVEAGHLNGQLSSLQQFATVLAHKNPDQGSADYQAAIAGLQAASAQIQSAINGSSSISEALSAISNALIPIATLANS